MKHSTQHRLLVAFVAFIASQACMAAALSARQAKKIGERCWSDVRVLSDDAMEGRRAGTPGHRRAAEFVAAQFRQARLAAGRRRRVLPAGAARIAPDRREEFEPGAGGHQGKVPLELGKDAIFLLRGAYSKQLEAPMIFVGDGLKLPQYGVDDLSSLDLKGKVVVTFITAPPTVPGAAGAHFGSIAERWKVYRAAGAVGMVGVPNPVNMDLPWERIAQSRFEPYMVLGGGAEDLLAGQQLLVQFNPESFGKLLVGTQYDTQADLQTTQRRRAAAAFRPGGAHRARPSIRRSSGSSPRTSWRCCRARIRHCAMNTWC